jgi:hypothetical protein
MTNPLSQEHMEEKRAVATTVEPPHGALLKCAFVLKPAPRGEPAVFCNQPASVELVSERGTRLSLCAWHHARLGRRKKNRWTESFGEQGRCKA